mmetsp:Transcript_6363/g.25469  ORF Transcript_6363/g.25469 Transcript_6363/m.25469 type:complete len:272 (+) Transcript_6363:368-1183(+)
MRRQTNPIIDRLGLIRRRVSRRTRTVVTSIRVDALCVRVFALCFALVNFHARRRSVALKALRALAHDAWYLVGISPLSTRFAFCVNIIDARAEPVLRPASPLRRGGSRKRLVARRGGFGFTLKLSVLEIRAHTTVARAVRHVVHRLSAHVNGFALFRAIVTDDALGTFRTRALVIRKRSRLLARRLPVALLIRRARDVSLLTTHALCVHQTGIATHGRNRCLIETGAKCRQHLAARDFSRVSLAVDQDGGKKPDVAPRTPRRWTLRRDLRF